MYRTGRIEREKKTLKFMVELYCSRSESSNDKLCTDCTAVLQYALNKLDRCPFGDKKPSCRRCTKHCYKPDMRDKIRMIMQYSGPRMLFRAPVMAIMHLTQL